MEAGADAVDSALPEPAPGPEPELPVEAPELPGENEPPAPVSPVKLPAPEFPVVEPEPADDVASADPEPLPLLPLLPGGERRRGGRGHLHGGQVERQLLVVGQGYGELRGQRGRQERGELVGRVVQRLEVDGDLEPVERAAGRWSADAVGGVAHRHGDAELAEHRVDARDRERQRGALAGGRDAGGVDRHGLTGDRHVLDLGRTGQLAVGAVRDRRGGRGDAADGDQAVEDGDATVGRAGLGVGGRARGQ